MNSRFDRMIEEVNLMSRSSDASSPRRRRRIYSSGSSSIGSYDLPKTPHTYPDHSGRLGKDFSVLKMKGDGAYMRPDEHTRSDSTEPEDQGDGAGAWQNPRTPKAAEGMPDWLTNTLSTLQPTHPLRRLMPGLKSPPRKPKRRHSSMTYVSETLPEVVSGGSVFAFKPPETQAPSPRPDSAPDAPQLEPTAIAPPSSENGVPILMHPELDAVQHSPGLEEDATFVSLAPAFVYQHEASRSLSPQSPLMPTSIPDNESSPASLQDTAVSVLPFSRPGPANQWCPPRPPRPIQAPRISRASGPHPDLSVLPAHNLGTGNTAPLNDDIRSHFIASRPPADRPLLTPSKSNFSASLRSDHAAFLDTRRPSIPLVKLVRFHSVPQMPENVSDSDWQPFSKPGPLTGLRSPRRQLPYSGNLSTPPDDPQINAEEEDLGIFRFSSSPPLGDASASAEYEEHTVPPHACLSRSSSQLEPAVIGVGAHHGATRPELASGYTPSGASPRLLYFASPTEDPSSPHQLEADAPPHDLGVGFGSDHDTGSPDTLQSLWAAVIQCDAPYEHEAPPYQQYIPQPPLSSTAFHDAPPTLAPDGSAIDCLQDDDGVSEEGWVHIQAPVTPAQAPLSLPDEHEEPAVVKPFAPAPGIYVSPLKPQDAISPWDDDPKVDQGEVLRGGQAIDDIEEVAPAGHGGSQASEHDSIESWSS
ncbi:hypothetical protein FA95DRAFT_1574962 [Auriscalpium vulgare]|uniref:Uncharacterized protein n=1 Tax=Auriscalpium vulgare TaxID=40419 RepID=A0ACB8RHZ2_9AGAM|nr:hypothetical protein FA95DRAFT_1574962 [Auriscalpium vulgare]